MAVFDNINLSSSSGVKPSLIEYYERTILDNAKPELLHVKDAQKRFVPKNNGRTVHCSAHVAFCGNYHAFAGGRNPERSDHYPDGNHGHDSTLWRVCAVV